MELFYKLMASIRNIPEKNRFTGKIHHITIALNCCDYEKKRILSQFRDSHSSVHLGLRKPDEAPLLKLS